MTWWGSLDWTKMKVEHKVLSFDDTYTSKLEMDPETMELILPIPDEVIQELGWGLGDNLEVIDNSDGTLTVRKIDNA